MVQRRIAIEGRDAQEDTYKALITSELGGYFLKGLDIRYLEGKEGITLLLDGSPNNVNRLHENLKRSFAESSSSSRIGKLEPYKGYVPAFSRFVKTHVPVYTVLQLSAGVRAITTLNENLRTENEQLDAQVKELEGQVEGIKGIGEEVKKIGESISLEILKTK